MTLSNTRIVSSSAVVHRITERKLVHEVKSSEVSVRKIIRDHMHMGKVSARLILW